jgi:sugar phosphate isomerase/epimerase
MIQNTFKVCQESTSRRDFIKAASVLSLGSILLSNCAWGKEKGVGLQLYTIRDDINEDLVAALKQVADIGYTNLEEAGYNEGKFYGIAPTKFKEMISDMNMRLIACHTPMSGIRQGWEKRLEDSIKAGCKYIVVSSLPGSERKALDNYKKAAEEFNKAGEISKKYGLQLAYHNHAFEFEELDGQIPYEVMLNETDQKLVTFELDLYWSVKAGFEPVDLIQRYPGRFELWHVKDMDNTQERYFTEVGSGIIDFKSIFNQKKRSGMKYYFVEQDICRNLKPMEAIAKSYQYLSKQRYV